MGRLGYIFARLAPICATVLPRCPTRDRLSFIANCPIRQNLDGRGVMSIRKRSWKNSSGEVKEAWVVDYVDQAGKRRLKTFRRKKEADAFETRARFEIAQGTHTPDSASVTVAQAASKWLDTCRADKLEDSTIDAYEQHCRLHINPFLGGRKLSQLTAPIVREFRDQLRRGDPAPGEEIGRPRSDAMVKRIVTSLSTLVADAQERGLVARNAARDLRASRKRGKQTQHESRHKGKVAVGVDIFHLQPKLGPSWRRYRAAGGLSY